MPRTDDLSAVRAILSSDRAWSVYALADLAPEYRTQAEWRCAAAGRPALLLIYRGFHPPVLFALGAAEDLKPLLAEVTGEKEVYLSVRPEVPGLLRPLGYNVRGEKCMWRMLLDSRRFQPPGPGAVRLGPGDEAALRRLFADGEPAGEAPGFFHPSMLRHGVYYGIREEGALVAVAGTHVLAREEDVAGLGNVYTRRDRRGRGFGLRATAAVTAELLRMRVGTIALNVEARNAGAIRIYERLGFAHYCDFREAVAVR